MIINDMPSLKKDLFVNELPKFENSSPQEILSWVINAYGSQIVLACSFGGPSGMVLLDMAIKIQPDIPVFYLNTGFLFPETRELAKRASDHYNITPIVVRPKRKDLLQTHTKELWTIDPDQCCDIRKVRPQQDFLRGYQAWITGIRRDQSPTRQTTPVIQWDNTFELIKVCPLVNWSEQQIWQYIADNAVPYNILHDRNYPSIGCTHCTRPIKTGEDSRAGRWSNFTKTECGLHAPVFQDEQHNERGTS